MVGAYVLKKRNFERNIFTDLRALGRILGRILDISNITLRRVIKNHIIRCSFYFEKLMNKAN